MGQDLKFVEFSDIEQKQIEEVLARDEALRNVENNRISSIQSELEKLDNKVDLLSKDKYFSENHCLQCFSQFMILLNPKYACTKCLRHYCKKCLLLIEKENVSLCLFCRKTMTVESQKNTWFYGNVQNKLKSFGSEKIKRLFSRGKSEGEDNDDDSYDKVALPKRPSLGDIFSTFRNSTGNVSDSGFSTASSRRNFTLMPDFIAPSHDAVDLNKDVDLEVLIKQDSARSSWNLTPVRNRIPFSARDNYAVTNHDSNDNNVDIDANRRNHDDVDDNRRSSLSSELSDDFIDDIVDSNQRISESPISETKPRSLPSKSTSLKPHIHAVPRTPSPSPQTKDAAGESPVFLQLPEDAHVDAGTSAEFVCVVGGTLPIEVYWYREGSELLRIDESDGQKYVVSKAGRSHGFVVIETTPADRGYYMCIAVNDYGRKEHMIKLTVLDHEESRVLQKPAAEFKAEISSNQKPEIFTPPVAQPRQSRLVSTEVIRCGDFSLTNDQPIKRRQDVFPDTEFVPLSSSEKEELTVSSSSLTSSLISEDIFSFSPLQSTTKHISPPQNSAFTATKLKPQPQTSASITAVRHSSLTKQHKVEQSIVTGEETSERDRKAVDEERREEHSRSSPEVSWKRTSDSMDKRINYLSDQDNSRGVYDFENNYSTELGSFFDYKKAERSNPKETNQSTSPSLQFSANHSKRSDSSNTSLESRIQATLTGFEKTNLATRAGLESTKQAKRADSSNFKSTDQENRLYYDDDEKRHTNSETVKRAIGDYLLQSTGRNRTNITSANVEGIDYLSDGRSEKNKLPSVRELSKRYSGNEPTTQTLPNNQTKR